MYNNECGECGALVDECDECGGEFDENEDIFCRNEKHYHLKCWRSLGILNKLLSKLGLDDLGVDSSDLDCFGAIGKILLFVLVVYLLVFRPKDVKKYSKKLIRQVKSIFSEKKVRKNGKRKK